MYRPIKNKYFGGQVKLKNKNYLIIFIFITMPLFLFAVLSFSAKNANSANESAPPYNAKIPNAVSGPFSRYFNPHALPNKAIIKYFPYQWLDAYLNTEHNTAVKISKKAPAWMRKGVSWKFPEARAWPLHYGNPYGIKIYGFRGAAPTQTQYMGNALGVSVANGIVYAESDDNFIYALNAKTGRLIWRNSPVENNLMGIPLVYHGLVFVSAGSVGFNFFQLVRYKEGKTPIRGAHISFNGIFALDALNGKLAWQRLTYGEQMASPAIHKGILFYATGNSKVYAVNALTGKTVWVSHVRGVDNMSNPAYYKGRIFVSFAFPNHLYCLNAATGRLIWQTTIPGATNTGMGDVSPAVSRGIIVMDAVAYPKIINDKKTVQTILAAFSSGSGKILWIKKEGRGLMPPAFKGSVPMIHNGIVYSGNPANSTYQARNLYTGKLLWLWKIPNPGPAGAGRGNPTYYNGRLYISQSKYIYVLNPKNGKLIGKAYVGGRMGIVNPVIIGGTVYLSNSWDWIVAKPLRSIIITKHK